MQYMIWTCKHCQKQVEVRPSKHSHPGFWLPDLCMDCHIEQVATRRDDPTAEHNRRKPTTDH